MASPLGEFEQMVLLAALRVRGPVYGVPIVEEIEQRTGRSVSPAAVYVTLRRLVICGRQWAPRIAISRTRRFTSDVQHPARPARQRLAHRGLRAAPLSQASLSSRLSRKLISWKSSA
jgi:hypothetical protein